jgi:hypothetical protein
MVVIKSGAGLYTRIVSNRRYGKAGKSWRGGSSVNAMMLRSVP